MTIINRYTISLLVCGITLFMLFLWHRSVVNSEIEQVKITIENAYNRSLLNAIEQSNVVANNIEKEKKENEAKFKKALSDRDAKYNATVKWLQSLPNSANRFDNPSNPSTPESRSEDIIGKLSRQDAIDLNQYSADAEEMKQGLLLCYKQYDDVKSSLDELRLKHTSKTD